MLEDAVCVAVELQRERFCYLAYLHWYKRGGQTTVNILTFLKEGFLAGMHRFYAWNRELFCLTVPCLCSIWYGLHLWSITCRFMRVSLLSDWQSDWQMNRQSDWVTTRLYNWLIRPAERPSAMLAHWLTGSLTDYLNDSLGDERRPAVWLTVWLLILHMNKLAECQTDWLTDILTVCLAPASPSGLKIFI